MHRDSDALGAEHLRVAGRKHGSAPEVASPEYVGRSHRRVLGAEPSATALVARRHLRHATPRSSRRYGAHARTTSLRDLSLPRRRLARSRPRAARRRRRCDAPRRARPARAARARGAGVIRRNDNAAERKATFWATARRRRSRFRESGTRDSNPRLQPWQGSSHCSAAQGFARILRDPRVGAGRCGRVRDGKGHRKSHSSHPPFTSRSALVAAAAFSRESTCE